MGSDSIDFQIFWPDLHARSFVMQIETRHTPTLLSNLLLYRKTKFHTGDGKDIIAARLHSGQAFM